MLKKVITTLALVSFAQAQICSTVPESLSDAEYLLRTQEIDSTCFEQFRELILNPVDPRREGWKRLGDLFAEQDGLRFPSVHELANLPESTTLDTLLARYPHIEQFAPFITFESSDRNSPIHGVADLKISGMVSDHQPRTTGRGAFTVQRTGSFGELAIEDQNGEIRLSSREFTGRFPAQNLELSVGNFQTPKRSLLWGSFDNRTSTSDEAILFGTGRNWNGVSASFAQKNLAFRSFAHRSLDESVQAISAEYKYGRFAPELTILRAVRSDTGWIASVAVRDSADRFRVESNFERDGGIALALTANRFDGKSRGSLELWHCSDHYQPEFSSRVQQTMRRYDSSGAITGITSRWIQRGVLVRGETKISGELVPAGGRTDVSTTIALPRLIESSIRNRLFYQKSGSDEVTFYENRFRLQPKVNRLSFPVAQENRFDHNGWNRSSLIAGVALFHTVIKPETEFRLKWYRDQAVQPEWRISCTHRFFTRGSSAFSLTVPVTEPERIVLYGRATLIF